MIYSLILSTLVVISCIACIAYAIWGVLERYWEINPVWSPDGQFIAFECYYGRPDWDGVYKNDGYEICVIGANGEGFLRLTTNDRSDRYPTWSPDGKRIAFASNGFTTKGVLTERIVLINRDGTHLTDLAEGALDDPPSWSPDGRYIAYQAMRGTLAVVNVQSGEVTSPWGGGRGDDTDNFGPVWSPDGRRIAFISDRDGPEEVYVVNVDGTGETKLTQGAARSGSPAWSPDGKRIAFLSLKGFQPEVAGSGYWALELIEPDGSNRVQLSHYDAGQLVGTPGQLVWTPDGQYLIFSPSYRSYDSKIFMINVDGGAETQLAAISRSYRWLNFSPNGRRVAFVREQNPGAVYAERIWIANIDGSNEIKLTQQK